MRLYSGTTAGLVDDSVHNRIATKLSDAFFVSFGFKPHEPEVRSWRESLRAVSQVFQAGAVLNHGVILEYTLPMCSKRLDCLVTGNDECLRPNAVIIELKQWDRCEDGGGANEVVTWVGGANRDVLHPSAQVRQYKMYLEDSHTAFSATDPINLSACSYLHNYPFEQSDVLFAERFQSLLRDCPLFTADDVEHLIEYLHLRLKTGDNGDILDRVERSRYRASKKLLDHVSRVISGKSEYVLLDEQLVVFDRIMKDAQEGIRNKSKSVVIVKGGPGTGKSVIALKLLGDLSAKGLNTHYVTGSRAFTKTVREIVDADAYSKLIPGVQDQDRPVMPVFTGLSQQVTNLGHTRIGRVVCRGVAANPASAHRVKLDVAHELESLGRVLTDRYQVLGVAHPVEAEGSDLSLGQGNPVIRVKQFIFPIAVQAELSGIRTGAVHLPGVILDHEPLATVAPEVALGR